MAGARQEWAGSAAAAYLPQGLIYPELVHSGFVETLTQNTDAFNGASQNAIRTVPQRAKGDFLQESFFKNTNLLINRRAVEGSPNNPAVSSSEVDKDEHISVKLNRRIGPIDQTFDSFRKLGGDVDLEVLS